MSVKKISFVLFVSVVLLAERIYALNLDRIKIHFLSGDYQAAILEGEKILAGSRQAAGLDELYYLLGLSYLKDGNYLRASDIFEIILQEFKGSKFKDEARLSLGDTYLLRGNFDKAQGIYQELISSSPKSALIASAYHRLSQIAFKEGHTQKGKDYLVKLKQEFPQDIESRLNRDLYPLANPPSDFYYTVQVGSFSSSANAKNLMQKLIRQGYPAYIEEVPGQAGGKMYRVRVAKLRDRQEASILQNKLSREGYPAKVCP